MNQNLRVAFFCDSYLEVNGVAMTSKRLEDFAYRHNFPFLTIYGGKKTQKTKKGSVTRLEFKRSPLSFSLDNELSYDPLFQRYTNKMIDELNEFRPNVIHITGLNDVSILGAWLAHRRKLPILASWHTNLHEFAGRRLKKTFAFLGNQTGAKIAEFAEQKIFAGAKLYYKMGKVILAPNEELISQLHSSTKRTTRLMLRGVDTELFTPEKRTVKDDVFRFGFVGRLRPEKNVRVLADLEKELLKAGASNFEFSIIGDGSERGFLEKEMKHAKFYGYLHGEPLAEAFANMDVFVFPSETETFGQVVQEANASGVPAIVTNSGGPKFFTINYENGFVAENLAEFTKFALQLMTNPAQLDKMRRLSRKFALSRSWDAVFEEVYEAYAECRKIKPLKTGKNLSKPVASSS